MKHLSIKLNSPVEFVDVTPLNPLISRCQIKVCYVGEQPNRNGSVITKEVATQMANSLPGSPIVGFYNQENSDFEGHNTEFIVDDNGAYFKDTTRPYGFVDLNAKVWFEKFSDDGIEHEYLMTEGYLWTGQYPEAQRVIDKGNNQSMELDPELTTGYWAKENNEKQEFFIINEAIISKLCILGEDVEPCFEGASVTSMQFSFDEGFKHQLFALMEQIKEILKEGEVSMEENRDNSLEEVSEVEAPVVEEVPVEEPAPEVEEPEAPEAEGAEEPVAEVEAEEEPAPAEEEEKPEMVYNLEEIPEYVSLSHNYSALETEYTSLKEEHEGLKNQFAALNTEAESLRTFKFEVEKKEKEKMIASFYMLSDEDKAGVVARIDELSVSDIEKELSVICVRNKVSFSLDEEDKPVITTFNLDSDEDDNDCVPAWVKAVRTVAKEMD